MLDGGNTPESLHLFNLGFDVQSGEHLLNIIDQQGSSDIKELNMRYNPELWAQGGRCFEILQKILAR